MGYKFNHKLKYINWYQEGKLIKVTCDEFSAKIKELESNGGERVTKKTQRDLFYGFNYYLEKQGNWIRAYYSGDSGKVVLSTNSYDELKNTRKNFKAGAIALFTEQFRKDTGLGRYALNTAFGKTNEEFKRCIPKQFYYMNKSYVGMWWNKSISGIDDSSHYPSCAGGRMPDANTMIEVEGIVEPNDEYPFAFWLDSGNCAEKEVFDTRDWLNDPFWAPQLFDGVKGVQRASIRDTKTVLMKASQYKMDKTWKYFYDRRKIDEDAKLVMNSTIGQMHQKNEGLKRYEAHPFAHIVAIILGRANNKHYLKIKDIGDRNIVSVIVDSIYYTGSKEFGVSEQEKDLGRYVQEFTDCEGTFRSIMCYIIRDKDTMIKVRTSGFNVDSEGKQIDKEQLDIPQLWKLQRVRAIDELEV